MGVMESVNVGPCYARNLTLPLLFACPVRRAIKFSAPAAAVLCVLVCFLLAGCGKSAKQYLDRGNQLFSEGRYADASLNYRNAIQKSPNSGEAYYRLGLSLLKQSLAGEAYQAFNHAVSLDSRNTDAKVQLGDLALVIYARDPKHPVQLYNQAKTMADQLLASGGNRIQGMRLKAGLALIDNQPGSAVDIMREAQRIAPNNQEVQGELAQALLRDNRPDEAEKVARETVQRHPQFNPPYEILYAIYGSEQKWDQAEALLKQWSANKPKESSPVLRLAAFYYARKQPEAGEKTLQAMVDARDRFPQADLLAGDFHALIRNPEKALADYRRGESRDQSRKDVYQQREASTLASLGRYPEALKAADSILAKDPKNQFARTLKVEVLDRIGGAKSFKEAAGLANDLAKEAPNNSRYQMLAGQALLLSGNANDAYSHLQNAVKSDPQSYPAQMALARMELLRKNYPGVLQHSEAALAIRRNDSNARLIHVIGLAGTHAYGSAKSEAEQLARDTKDSRQVELQLGVIALGQARYGDAEALFRKLYKDKSEDLESLAGLVDTYEAEHLPDRAFALMKEETARTPDSKGKEALLVSAAEAAGKNDVALSELQKMAAQSPKSAEVQVRIGQVQMKSGNVTAALQAFQKAKQLAPNSKGIEVLVATAQDQLGRKTEALASYRKALAKSPDDPVVLNNLAFLIADTGGDTKEALQMISTAVRKVPNAPQLRDTLAWIYIKSHNTAEALPILQSLTTKYPEENTFRYHYAVALIQSGDRSSAKRQAEMALSKKPNTELTGELQGLLAQVK
jgi:tetratricopeptide (TPR) repeat protein